MDKKNEQIKKNLAVKKILWDFFKNFMKKNISRIKNYYLRRNFFFRKRFFSLFEKIMVQDNKSFFIMDQIENIENLHCYPKNSSKNFHFLKKEINFFLNLIGNFLKNSYQFLIFRFFFNGRNQAFFKSLSSFIPNQIVFIKKKIGKIKGRKKNYSLRKFLIKRSKNFVNKAVFLGNKKKEIFNSKRKFSTKGKIINIKVFYDRLNFLFFKNSIKGFTHDSFQFLFNYLDNYAKNLIKEIRKITLISKKTKDQIKKDWGENFTSFFQNDIKKISKKISYHSVSEKNFQNLIRLFKKKKRVKINKKPRKPIFLKNTIEKSNVKKKSTRRKILEENISKTNKTLMTLLNGILQKRIKILREATKCLCKYKPLPLKISIQKKNENTVEQIEKSNFILEEKNLIFLKRNFLNINAEDCLAFLKSKNQNVFPKFFSKWFFSVMIDHNFEQIQKSN
ncbi:hypothetical protein HAN_3g417 (nucleomorph) [Hemiselmis andersenii]|uniref:Uncharacterized protein n=1 Tax=Hemiselmis andersenii TaxID=464988 RepID=A9BL44_HEMAN|nr:hypothetical protein HAN_3g417 [Hemiselmis andersenii]ABW98227.1 hypothetical protein HAN_3g417 [Hemiselmis andersenii]|mmetsp:Transcript_33858/g.82519  ORF Transcript_33858/g.82519 Transcript_33858/m.82519 type:complete len:449 (+) Transcript_33858:852-2198(+)